MTVNVIQKTFTMSKSTKKDMEDMLTLARLEEVKITESSILSWALRVLKDSIVEMKNNGINIKPMFLEGQSFKNHKPKKNKYLED